MSAAAWLAADEDALCWVELTRHSSTRGRYIVRAQIRRVGVELLAAHGVEHALLMGAVHQGLSENRAARRIDVAQRQHDQLLTEIRERLAALDVCREAWARSRTGWGRSPGYLT